MNQSFDLKTLRLAVKAVAESSSENLSPEAAKQLLHRLEGLIRLENALDCSKKESMTIDLIRTLLTVDSEGDREASNMISALAESEIPFVSFSAQELEASDDLPIGSFIRCPHCNQKHEIQAGKSKDGLSSPTLGFYSCGEKSYVASLNGKSVMKRFQR